MGTKSTFELYDRILGGRLGALLCEWRAEVPRPSYETIARRLAEHDVAVTGETVRRWCQQFDNEPTKAAS